jgi:hypothetical protein
MCEIPAATTSRSRAPKPIGLSPARFEIPDDEDVSVDDLHLRPATHMRLVLDRDCAP